MSIVSYLVIDLVKTGLNRIHRRPTSSPSLVLLCSIACTSFSYLFFRSRTFLCPSLSSSLPFLSHHPLRFFRLRGIYMRAIKCEQISTRARCAQVCAVRNILGILKESRFSTTGQPKEICDSSLREL